MDKKGKKKQEDDMIKPKTLVNVVPKKFTISFDMAVFDGNVDGYESPKAADKQVEVKRDKRCVIL